MHPTHTCLAFELAGHEAVLPAGTPIKTAWWQRFVIIDGRAAVERAERRGAQPRQR